MRILMIHLKDIKYWAVEEAIENPPDPPSKFEGNECVAGFISVEEGDTPDLSHEAASELAQHANRFKLNCIVVYPFAHLSSSLAEPNRAVNILKSIEDELKKMGFTVNRAPFGWYKGFSITCPGHPMCELSRTITSPKGPFYIKDSNKILIKEAIENKIFDNSLLNNPWDNDSIGAQEKFGILSDGINSIGKYVINSLIEWFNYKNNIENVSIYSGSHKEIYGIDGLSSTIKSCLDMGRYVKDQSIIIQGIIPGSEIMILPFKTDKSKFNDMINELMNGIINDTIEIASSSQSGFNIPYDIDYDLDLILYKSRNNGLVLLGGFGNVRENSITFIGPIRNIASSLIDYGLKMADKGKTPSLPFWLSPYQVAIIPVKETHEDYAKEIFNEVFSIGIRVYYDPPGKSLGTRIRAAGKSWVPIIAVVGDKEKESSTVNLRKRWLQGSQEVLQLDEFYNELKMLRSQSPFNRPISPPVS
ncbi:threonyl-tRNA synthetase editing domain-containing protein [Caldisphaera sp.]|uniref:threonyl-tRNA synthetase editing domain-containing protein n=1 Tax=Caldisphaera sp. TaxID=2060322 RepID=UPI0025BD90D7|nr:threonyl-tRNA synthetase editing domain-containing protein [Caldisphaera sp.]